MEADRLSYYETSFDDLRESLIRVLGAPTVNRLVDRAVTEIARAHPGIASLRCQGDEVIFEGVRSAFADATDDQIRDAFTALNGVLLVFLARLLGKEIADRLTDGLSVTELLRRGRQNGS